MIVIQATYEHLRPWIEQLPHTFFQEGEVIYDARNQIRTILAPDGNRYNVKRYCQPKWYNRIIYTWFRKTKAQRAYANALLLQARGISTPTPIAYILCGKTLLAESFLITQQLPYRHRLYEWGDGVTTDREPLIRAFGQFTANMHNHDVLHLDYSPGNILYDLEQNEWHFSVVDINRMYIGPISIQEGCNNMGRLWGGKAVYRLIAQGYAQARNASEEQCFQWMWHAHTHFWKNRKKPIEYQPKTSEDE